MKVTISVLIGNQPDLGGNYTFAYVEAARALGWEYPGAEIGDDTLTADHTVIRQAFESLSAFIRDHVDHGDGVSGENLIEILGHPQLIAREDSSSRRELDFDKFISEQLAGPRQAKIEEIVDEAWEIDSCTSAMAESWHEDMPPEILADLLEECGASRLAAKLREV